MNSFYMNEALKQSLNSCDPSTKVGCVIVKDNKVISVGFNTLPSSVPLNACPIDVRDGDYWSTKYPYLIHSEAKAIVDAKCDLRGSSLYVTLFPCNECAKLIIESGIKEVYYMDDKYAANPDVKIAKKMFIYADVAFKQILT